MTTARLLVVNCWRRQLVYRASFLGYLAITVFYYSAQFIFFRRLFDFSAQLGGYSQAHVALMFHLFVSLYLCIEFAGSSIESFFQKVYQGGIDPYLCKPIPVGQLIFLGWCFPANLILLACVQLLPVLGIFPVAISATAAQWGLFALSAACSLVLNLCFLLLLNLATLIVQRKLPADYIHSRVFDVSMVPSPLFPRRVLAGLILLLPIALSASLPVSVLVERAHGRLALQLAVSCATVLGTGWLLRRVLRRYEGTGG